MIIQCGFCKDALHVGLRQHGVIFQLRFPWIINAKSVSAIERSVLSLGQCIQSRHSGNLVQKELKYTYAEEGCCRR